MVPGAGKKGAQGYELQFATNILGPYLFTKLLLPILRKTAAGSPRGSVRVCWASSLATDLMTPKRGITFAEDGSPISKGEGGGPPEYGVSKVANYFLSYEFGQRFGNSDGVLHNVSVHFFIRRRLRHLFLDVMLATPIWRLPTMAHPLSLYLDLRWAIYF
jgi:NAD(P)-dependent dehydrogenase (short-subunit alcohol dehydrogenase family)